jgi:hypothetical protein
MHSPNRDNDAGNYGSAWQRLKGAGGKPFFGGGASPFGWLVIFAGFDMPASSAQTRKQLGWNPTGVKPDNRSREHALFLVESYTPRTFQFGLTAQEVMARKLDE